MSDGGTIEDQMRDSMFDAVDIGKELPITYLDQDGNKVSYLFGEVVTIMEIPSKVCQDSYVQWVEVRSDDPEYDETATRSAYIRHFHGLAFEAYLSFNNQPFTIERDGEKN